MAVDLFRINREVQKLVRQATNQRSDSGSGINYSDPKEGMFELHCAWQELMAAVKRHEAAGEGAVAALKLAAMAIKFVSDLGDPIEMRLK